MEIYPHHFSSTLTISSILLFLHVHFSGYGATKYLSFLTGLEQVMQWLPGENAYNLPISCGLPICGYPLTNFFHGLAGANILLLTAFFAADFLIAWYLCLTTNGFVAIALTWEFWELLTGITICRPGDFPNAILACAACEQMISDTVRDIACGFNGILIMAAFLVILDRHYSKTESSMKT